MRGRVFTILFSPTLFVLLGFAQQSGSNPTVHAPIQNIGTTCKEPLTPTSTGDFWNGDEPNVANLFGHYINTKKDVQKEIKPIQNCLDELDEAATSHTNMIKDLDANAQHGIKLVSSKTDEADAHATDATNRANAALAAANQASTRASKAEEIAVSTNQYKGEGTQTEIRFRPGQTALSKTAKDALDQLGSSVKAQHNYVIELRGYAQGHGQTAINDSRGMADSVARYLILNCEIPVHRVFVLGMGNADGNGIEKARSKQTSVRRVDVSLLTNNGLGSTQH